MAVGHMVLNRVRVSYHFRAAQKDCRHLLVIFSGFRPPGTVDFGGSSVRGLRSNILWLIDDFDGHNAYYLRAFGGRDVTEAVAALIEHFRDELGLLKGQVTLAGFSKGASAAIFYGVRFGYRNVVAAVPQFKIGSYVENFWSKDLASMGGAGAVAELDHLLEQAIAEDTDSARNVYLITSPEDDQYTTEALPLASLLQRYDNFNLVISHTPFIREHIQVTRYNVPLILSLLTLLGDGVAPRLERVDRDAVSERQIGFWKGHPELGQFSNVTVNGSAVEAGQLALSNATGEFKAEITRVSLDSGVLDFEGFAVFAGKPVTGYGQLAATLRLSSARHEIDVKLGGKQNSDLSLRLFDGALVDYSFAGITSSGNTGIPLAALPFGRYRVGLSARQGELHGQIEFMPAPRHEYWGLARDKVVGTVCVDGKWELLALPVIGRRSTDCYFEEVVCELVEGRLFVEGYFAPRGRTLSKYGDVSFSLSLVRPGDQDPVSRVIRTVPLATGTKRDVASRSGEEFRDQNKGYYATPKYEGVAIDQLAEGEYELYVNARMKDDVMSFQLKRHLNVTGSWDVGRKPSFGIIGACVTRDNFSSRVVPRWRDDFVLQGSHYQMALVSLMSSPLVFDQHEFADLDAHSREATRRDFTKEYLQELVRDNPDYLLVDTRTDARFGVLEFAGSWITNNVWKLGASRKYRSMGSQERVSMASDPQSYIGLFREACKRLAQFLEEHNLNTQILLVSAREVQGFRGRAGTGRFPGAAKRMFNTYWSALDEVALDVFKCPRIEPMDGQVFASSDHPWGKGPLHFEDRFYSNFRAQLLTATGYRSHLELQHRAQSSVS